MKSQTFRARSLILALACWLDRHPHDVVESLQEKKRNNRVVRRHRLGGMLNDYHRHAA